MSIIIIIQKKKALKLDISKNYIRVKWIFLEKLLKNYSMKNEYL